MSLNIKNPKAHELAERFARLTGETLPQAVTTALRERLERIEDVGAVDEERFRKLQNLVNGSRRLWREPYLSVDHGELLYDEHGFRNDRRFLDRYRGPQRGAGGSPISARAFRFRWT